MDVELTHASFFSGSGGTDLGLERAGWRTISFSEIDPYANAVLAERWPGIPNLGDITTIAGRYAGSGAEDNGPEYTASAGDRLSEHGDSDGGGRNGEPAESERLVSDWQSATLWSGGFPCQDLSIAGKRAGLAGKRSGLAFAFLDLVEQYRPPWILLENVPGLLSSNSGRDLGALLSKMGEFGYGWAYRILDARYFGVPQRRRRVFIVGSLGTDRAAEVLFDSAGSRGDITESDQKESGSTDRFEDGIGKAGILTQSVNVKWWRGTSGPSGNEFHNLLIDPVGALTAGTSHAGLQPSGQEARAGHIIISPQNNPARSGEVDGVAGRSHDSQKLESAPSHFRKARRAQSNTDFETWVPDEETNTLNPHDQGDIRTVELVVGSDLGDDPLLPIGLDSHRYRLCGNGVVAPVAEWLGTRLRLVVEGA